MVFVSRIIQGDGSEQLNVFGDADEAERIWPQLVRRATDVVAEDYMTLMLKLYEVDETDPDAARAAVMAGQAKEVKWVRVKSPKTLHSKVTKGGPGAVNARTLAKAEMVLESKKDDYLLWVRRDLDVLDATLAELGDAMASGAGGEGAILEKIYQQSYKIRSQGGTFGFALMTSLGHHLCRLLDALDAKSAQEVEAIRVHIDAMKMVVSQKVSGDGGELGGKLLDSLSSVSDKMKNGAS